MFDPRILRLLKGFKQVPARKVIIELEDKTIEIENPQVMVIEVQGTKFYTISGEEKEIERFSEEDIKLLMEKTGKSREEVIEALKKTGDVLEALELLSGEL